MDILLKRVDELLRETRKDKKELTSYLGLKSSSVYSDWLAGRVTSYKKYIKPMSEFFDVSADYLIGKSNLKGDKEGYEDWGCVGDDISFNSLFNFGGIIKQEREAQGETLESMSAAIGLTVKDLQDCEEGILPINFELAEKMSNYLGSDASQLSFDYGAYWDEVPEEFHESVRKWEKLKEAAEEEAKRDSDRVWALKEAERIPSEATPLGTIVYFPVLGRVAAGNGVLAQNEILDYEFTRADKICSGENYFWLKVKGDSMSPKIDDGDLVLVKQQTSVDSGDYAVVLVDGEDGVVKKVCYGADWIELKSVNPYYPVRQFTGPGVQQISVVGRVIEVRRTL